MEYVNDIYPCTGIRIMTFYIARIMSYICHASARPPAFLSTTPLHSLQLWKECGEQSRKAPNGYHSLNMANGLG